MPDLRIRGGAPDSLTTTDANGRKLVIRQPSALSRLRLFKVLGSELSLNAPYFGMALLASSVTELDGVPVPHPASEDQVEALVHRLGDAGVAAVAEAIEAAQGAQMGRAEQGN